MSKDNIESTYPLSPMQQGMLFHSLYAPESGANIEQTLCTLPEALNISAFEQAWQRVVERHPVLRTRFRWEGLAVPLQEVHQRVPLSLERHDWRGLSLEEREERLQLYLRADRRRGFQLTEAPLLRLALFECGESDCQFVWTYHHVLLDGRSFPVVVKELFAFYEAFCHGQELSLEPPRPYRDYIEWLLEQEPLRAASAEAFWRQALKGFAAPTSLMGTQAAAGVAGQGEEYDEQAIRLSVEATSALRALAQQQELTLNTLVQGAWALLLSRYSGEEEVVFGATRACRQSALPGADAMVGLFINTLPVRVCLPSGMALVPWLKALRAQQIAVREHEHTPLIKGL
jgi:hypothetical protein